MTSIAPPSPELLEELGVILPPTEEELPYSDGMPMESKRHISQMNLLIETLEHHWKDRERGFVGGNMFVYFNLKQLKNMDFRGPDFFAVVDAEKRERKSWVCWQEGLGPDVVIELLSTSTAKVDKVEKKRVYEQQLRVPEYYWFHPFTGELAGFELYKGKYRPLKPDKQGRLYSKKLDLYLAKRASVFNGIEAEWLRWTRPDGGLVTSGEERAEEAEFRASTERAEREAAEQQVLAERAERESAEQKAREAEQQVLAERAERESAEQQVLAERAERESAEQKAREAEQQVLAERAERESAEQKAAELSERLRAMEEEMRRLRAAPSSSKAPG